MIRAFLWERIRKKYIGPAVFDVKLLVRSLETLSNGKFSGAYFDQNTKIIHDKRKGSLISMKCHFKLDAGFLEQPTCA